ncbi:hypothetical protein HK405_008049 [Cladochytrium tenue]|nr:hypothetical protein HK405_008049 [Cladochytrium tenue]
MQAVAKAVEQNYSIKELDVSANPFQDAGAAALFKAVLSSNCLRRVALRGVKLSRDLRARLEEVRSEKPETIIVE